jgi:hypothetical protein
LLIKKFLTVGLIFTILITTVSCSQITNKIIDNGAISTPTTKIDSNFNSIENKMGNIINGGFVTQQGTWL